MQKQAQPINPKQAQPATPKQTPPLKQKHPTNKVPEVQEILQEATEK